MNVPSYITNPQNPSSGDENYNAELNQNLQDSLSDNGWTVPQLTNAQLTVDIVTLQDGSTGTLANLMSDGTLWFSVDASPPCYVGKISGSLVKFTTTSYP